MLAGDYNVIPEPRDAKLPEAWVSDALFQPESRAKLPRADEPRAHRRRAPASRRRPGALHLLGLPGRRLADGTTASASTMLLLSPQAADRLAGVAIHKAMRSWDKPSDHVPVMIDLAV